jgi:hypothetical protein
MKLGFFATPIYPLRQGLAAQLSRGSGGFVLAEDLGFSEACCGQPVDQAES